MALEYCSQFFQIRPYGLFYADGDNHKKFV